MTKLTRRLCLLPLLIASAATTFAATPTGSRLRDIPSPFRIGFALMNEFQTASDAAQYQDTARAEFNILTPENALKFDAVHPAQTTYNFAPADTMLAFATANGIAFHGHTLVWHSQLPGWVTGGNWNATTLTAVMDDHIDTVMGHYRGKALAWDVVNEALNDDGTRRTSVWQNVMGQTYIEHAFTRARAADAAAKLVYNDYNIETAGAKSNAVFAMAQDFKSRGVPIDGIGFQMHLTNGGIGGQALADNMARFAALGLEIYITEMDVRYTTPISAADLQNQATVYRTVIDRCRAQAACKSVQVWGVTDKYSWVPQTFPGQGDALLFDANYNAKPAYFAVQAGLGGGSATPTATAGPTATASARATATATPRPTATATATARTTPTATATTDIAGGLKIQYRAAMLTDPTNQIQPYFKIVNGGSSVAMSGLKIRYWYTWEGTSQTQQFACDYAQVGSGNVTGSFVRLTTPVAGADSYVEIGFTAGAGTIATGGNSGEIQSRFNKSDWSVFTQSNDYSYDATKTAYADWTKVTLYNNGVLVWGTEPGAGGATATATATARPTATATLAATATMTATATATAPPTATGTATATSVATATATLRPTATATATATAIATATPTATANASDPCASPTVITGSGAYAVTATGTCFKYVNTAFRWGGMFSVMNGQDATVSNTLAWYGGASETVTACTSNSRTLAGNGAQLNNFTVGKDSTGAMYVTISGNKTNTVNLSVQNWQNGSGCSVAPAPR
jgi:endo-1,4-beta-xylanase